MSTDPLECAAPGKTPEAITTQKFAVLGAGSAGMGVVCMLAKGMVKHVLTPLPAPCTGAVCMLAKGMRTCGCPSHTPFARLHSSVLPCIIAC